MAEKLIINRRYIYYSIFLVAAAAIFFVTRRLFFFDEDIFVTDSRNSFMSGEWQRSLTCQLSFKLDNFIWGKRPVGYHFTNLVLHFIDALLATAVLKELLKQATAYLNSFQLTVIPIVFLLLFLISPIHSEPLCYILARDALVVSFFCLGTVLLLLRSGFKNKFLILCSLVSFTFSLFSYEISWAMPALVLAITLFYWRIKILSFKKAILIALLYLAVFASWFLLKIGYMDRFVISDYKDDEFLKIDLLTVIKNSMVLLFRNFIPPYRQLSGFLTGCGIFMTVAVIAFIRLYRINKRVFFLALLLLLLTLLGFLAAAIIGIDSHDSESERYIYFSSCFAIMLLSVLLTGAIRNKQVLISAIFLITIYYCAVLFKTIGHYDNAGRFSKKYIAAVNEGTRGNKTVFVIDLPSQYHGALLFRAQSRFNANTLNSVTTLNEYMRYLYGRDSTHFVALSSKEVTVLPQAIKIYNKPLDSLSFYYPSQKFNFTADSVTTEKMEKFPFSKPHTVIIALKDERLFVFK